MNLLSDRVSIKDNNGALYYVLGIARDVEDLDVRVVYRKLLDDYRLCIGPTEMLKSTSASEQPNTFLIEGTLDARLW